MSSQMTEQLVEAAVLLAVGMTVVFAFLTLLIAGIHAIAWFCRVFPSVDAEPIKAPVGNLDKPSTTVSPQIAAAIAAAVHTHRHKTLKP